MAKRKKASHLSPLDMVAAIALLAAATLFFLVNVFTNELMRAFTLGAFYCCLIGAVLLFSFGMNARAMARARRDRD